MVDNAGDSYQCSKPHSHFSCKLCGKQYGFCNERDCYRMAQVLMNGHVLRVHPESVPNVIAKLRKSPKDLQLIRDQAAQYPELWKKLISILDN